MPCPYTTAKRMITYIRDVLSTPSDTYGGFAACPFAKPELDSRKLMLAELAPGSDINLVHIIEEFSDSEYKSLLIAQQFEPDQSLSEQDTKQYQRFINDLLDDMNLDHLKCICFNPNDTIAEVRQKAPYFLINIADRDVLSTAHNKLIKTQYFSNMSEDYLKFLRVKPSEVIKNL